MNLSIAVVAFVFVCLNCVYEPCYGNNEIDTNDDIGAHGLATNNLLHDDFDTSGKFGGHFARSVSKEFLPHGFGPIPWSTLSGGLIVVILGAIVSAGGIGGGGVFVTILVNFCHTPLREAVPLSKAMIFCGSLVSFAHSLTQRDTQTGRIYSNWTLVKLFTPGSLLGTSIGIVLNDVFPEALLFGLFAGLLLYVTIKTTVAAINLYGSEMTMVVVVAQDANNSSPPYRVADNRFPPEIQPATVITNSVSALYDAKFDLPTPVKRFGPTGADAYESLDVVDNPGCNLSGKAVKPMVMCDTPLKITEESRQESPSIVGFLNCASPSSSLRERQTHQNLSPLMLPLKAAGAGLTAGHHNCSSNQRMMIPSGLPLSGIMGNYTPSNFSETCGYQSKSIASLLQYDPVFMSPITPVYLSRNTSAGGATTATARELQNPWFFFRQKGSKSTITTASLDLREEEVEHSHPSLPISETANPPLTPQVESPQTHLVGGTPPEMITAVGDNDSTVGKDERRPRFTTSNMECQKQSASGLLRFCITVAQKFCPSWLAGMHWGIEVCLLAVLLCVLAQTSKWINAAREGRETPYRVLLSCVTLCLLSLGLSFGWILQFCAKLTPKALQQLQVETQCDSAPPSLSTALLLAEESSDSGVPQEAKFNYSQVLLVPGVSVASGILSGLLGVGGGMVTAPLFLHLELPPMCAVATASMSVMFTSTSTTIQFYLIGRLNLLKSIPYGILTLIASQIGQQLVYMMSRYGKPSYVIFVVAMALIVSTLLTFWKFYQAVSFVITLTAK